MSSILILLVIICIFYWIPKKQYEKTDYFIQTHNSYHSIRFNKGIKGEYLTWKYLQKLDGYKKYLFNCYIPKENGTTTEIDVILIHESGIYVFESKNYSGWIFGNESQQYWTQTLPSGRGRSQKEHFFNPVIQNNVHLKWLSKYIDKDMSFFYSYIIFSDRCTLKDVSIPSGQHHVINRYNVLSDVKFNARSIGQKLTENEINSLYALLQPLTQIDEAQKLAHIEAIQAKIGMSHPQNNPNFNKPNSQGNTCPLCGGRLILRTASKGTQSGKKFWGCSNYPKCRYTRNIGSEKDI